MVQAYDSSTGYQADPADALNVLFTRLCNGVEAALSTYYGASDPSSGALPSAWAGAGECGREWYDCGVDGTAANPVKKLWCQLTAGPTYGWRKLGQKKTKYLDAPVAVAGINALSGGSADIAIAAISLATDLDTVGVPDAGDAAHRVTAVWLRVKFRGGAAETLGTGATETPYLRFRKTGATDEQRIHAQADGGGFTARQTERVIRVPLDASEQLDFGYAGGGGTKAPVFDAYIVAIELET